MFKFTTFCRLLAALVLIGAAAVARADNTPIFTTKADLIVIEKTARKLTLYSHGHRLKTYKIVLGFGDTGPKMQAGDGKTPEGLYTIVSHNPRSAYHLSLGLSYPEPRDIARAAAMGVQPGGDVMIHGMSNRINHFNGFYSFSDWTAGCIALDNQDIEQIAAAVPDRTPVEIRP